LVIFFLAPVSPWSLSLFFISPTLILCFASLLSH
jgi:hypothetical protein